MALAFVAVRRPLIELPSICLADVTPERLAYVDLVIEAAHPAVVADQGTRILPHADLMVVSARASP
ncbi:MAG: hypothetical protein ACK5IN_06710 [Microbacterium sp.]|uniref:hypothetical protein n=1 Tax=Microbacterium sp. TaxID=51671 RepID=UPI003A8A378C